MPLQRSASLGERALERSVIWASRIYGYKPKVKAKQVGLKKILGADNPADIFTKYVGSSIIQKALSAVNMEQMTGQPACVPATMGA